MMRTRQRIKSNENYEAGTDVVITKGNKGGGGGVRDYQLAG